MAEFLQHELTSACLCWRLERRDGVGLGFTTHDRDLAIGGLVYRAAPGMLPSAVSVSAGFDADNVDVRGALSSGAITAEDLKAGRWDGAAVAIFMTDWRAPGAGDLVELSEGCDRRFETCVARFGNGVNFRGEPHLPGMDLLTRY